MQRFYSLDELKDEPVFVPYLDDGKKLEDLVELTPEEWRARYASMREDYAKFQWFYSPICARILKMEQLLRRICRNCLLAENHPRKNDFFEKVREMDLVLGLISQEEYAALKEQEEQNAQKFALSDRNVNRTLDEICEEISKNAALLNEEFPNGRLEEKVNADPMN